MEKITIDLIKKKKIKFLDAQSLCKLKMYNRKGENVSLLKLTLVNKAWKNI